MRFELTRYNLNVIYTPGKYMYLADALSRSYLSDSDQCSVEDYDILLCDYISVSDSDREAIESAMKHDSEMNMLKHVVKHGWPDKRYEVDMQIRAYWNYRDEITQIENLLFKGTKLIIPRAMRKVMIERIHETHLGTVKCKAKARDALFWPSMTKDIEEKVSRCGICARYQSRNPKEPLIPHEIPDRPWSKIGIDIFERKGHSYLISVCYYSKWPEISKLENTTSQCVIGYLKSHMSRYGIPDEVISDNARNFTSFEFEQFAKSYGFKHTTSSPNFPSSNGQVERCIQTIKRLVNKNDLDPNLAVMDYKNTELDGVGLSPAQLFLNRRLKTKLPIAKELLKPDNSKEISEKLSKRQQKQKFYYDRHVQRKALKPLQNGENVIFRHNDKWQEGKVKSKHDTPRSYIVENKDGKQYRRNRRHLRSSKVPVQIEPDIPPQASLDNNTQNMQNASEPEQQQHTDAHISENLPKPTITTRSGREIKQPSRFRDYVVSAVDKMKSVISSG
ncbi:uncharacterized protein K02A2.6-like [Mercenaria mercenaria]|uniref:uncharacterized protein K02A2.6-like n=1 Tax=Mercenaria mercenaria TaxID=6596 RepID=UPI00234F3349|nr:uncharacterized protein K02A2.6-like [Mercenaria mercenaria]